MKSPSSAVDGTQHTPLLTDQQAIERIFEHIDNNTTDLGDTVLRVPVEHYSSQERFDAERAMLRRLPVPFCPSAALPEVGSYVARTAAGTPLVVVRTAGREVRAFINACRHRGMQVAEWVWLRQGFHLSVPRMDLQP